MALQFLGIVLPGIHSKIEEGQPDHHEAVTHFPGVWGDSVIDEGAGGRNLSVRLWLNDPSFTSAAAVKGFLAILALMVGKNDTLHVTGGVPWDYGDCTFKGAKPAGDVLPVIGQGMPAGTYWCDVELHWRQNTVP